MSKKSIVSVIACVFILVLSKLIPEFGGLSQAGIVTLGITLSMVVLLVTEALPVGLVALLMIVLQPVLGVTESLAETASYFATPIFFFLLAAFCLATAMMKVPLANRILKFLLLKFGKNTKGAVTALLITTALLSSFIANLPALILIYGIALDFLKMFEDESERKQTGKGLCIGLVMAASIGGIATPVGNMPMMMAATFLADAGYPISFLQWMCFGVPIAVVLFIAMRFLLFKIHPPVEISDEKRQLFIDRIQTPEKFTVPEKWVVLIFTGMIICWLLNSKIPALNVMLVTVVGACFLLFPGFKILTWDEFNKSVSWPATLLTCSFVSLSSVLAKNGVTEWILNCFTQVLPANAGLTVIIAILGVFICASLLIISNGPALISIFGVPIIGVAATMGINPILLMIPLAFYTTYSYILPIDSISLITYASGNYSMVDMAKVGVLVTAVAIITMSLWIPVVGNFLVIG